MKDEATVFPESHVDDVVLLSLHAESGGNVGLSRPDGQHGNHRRGHLRLASLKGKHTMKGKILFIINRLKEPSTLAGLGVLAVMFGVPPGTVDVVVQAGGELLGAAAVLIPEGK